MIHGFQKACNSLMSCNKSFSVSSTNFVSRRHLSKLGGSYLSNDFRIIIPERYQHLLCINRVIKNFSSGNPQLKKNTINSDRRIKPEFPWKLALGTSALCGLLASYVIYEQDKAAKNKIARVDTSTIGKPKIGGPWTLTDQDGNSLSSSDLSGKYQLIYFGFSHCPDICPQELEKMCLVIEELDKKYGEIVQPIFITVDPKRDKPKLLKDYCKEFHSRLIGLTGTEEEIKEVTKLFRVYYNPSVTTDDNEDYLIDHSIIQYFMGKSGIFKDFFGKNLSSQEMVQRISEIIDQDLILKTNQGKIEEVP